MPGLLSARTSLGMKIWFPVIRGGSGTDIFTRRLAEALQRRGIGSEVTWFPIHFQFAPFLLRSVPPSQDATVIHTNSWNGFAFKRTGVPLVVTEHLSVFDPVFLPYKSRTQHLYHELLIRRFMKVSFREASATTAVSEFTALSLGRTLGIRDVQVIHDWVDTKTFLPAETDYRPGKRPFRLLFVGNLSRRKGADLLAPIMKELGPDYELRFTAGLRPNRKVPRESNMIPLGRITEEKDLIASYRWSDALLFPTRFEGFGLPAVEAMACGKPVIATNSSSIPEVVDDGITGILCPPDDIAGFVAACRRLSSDHELLRQYSQAARSRAEELFSEETAIRRYVDLYEKLAVK